VERARENARPEAPTSTPGSTIVRSQPRSAPAPTTNPVFRAVERSRTVAAERSRGMPMESPRAQAPATTRRGEPTIVRQSPQAGDLPGRTGPIRTAEIARLNRLENPGLDRVRTHDRDRWDDRRDWDGGRYGDGRHDWDGGRDHSRSFSHWSIGFGVGSWGSGFSFRYSSGWDWSSPRVSVGTSWYRDWDCWPRRSYWYDRDDSWLWRTSWCAPRWCNPVLVVPRYSRWDTCCDGYATSGVHAAICPSLGFTASNSYPYAGTSGVVTYVNGSVPVAYEAAPIYVAPPAAAASVATVYRTDARLGQMEWAAVPSSIVEAVAGVGPEFRAPAASRFLGRVPAGAWQVTFESQEREGGVVIAQCRGVTASQLGHPTIHLILESELTGVRPGDLLAVSGRLAEVTIDDAGHPAGRLVLDEVRIAR
jgi:hypothetical protein